MSALIENIKKDIDDINKFSSEFYNKTNAIIERVNAVNQRIDNIIKEEQQNEIYLSNLKQKVSTTHLNNVMKSLLKFKDDIEKKNEQYVNIIESNKKLIAETSLSIRDNSTIINTIYELVDNLDGKATELEKKIST